MPASNKPLPRPTTARTAWSGWLQIVTDDANGGLSQFNAPHASAVMAEIQARVDPKRSRSDAIRSRPSPIRPLVTAAPIMVERLLISPYLFAARRRTNRPTAAPTPTSPSRNGRERVTDAGVSEGRAVVMPLPFGAEDWASGGAINGVLMSRLQSRPCRPRRLPNASPCGVSPYVRLPGHRSRGWRYVRRHQHCVGG